MIALATAFRWALANWKLVGAGAILIAATIWHFNATGKAYDRGYTAADNSWLLREAAAKEAAQKAANDLQAKIGIIDAQHTTEMEKARASEALLRDDLRSARLRLSVRTVPNASQAPASDSPGVDNGSTRADIDPRDAEAIVSITQRGDEAIRQLTAAQDVIRAFTLPE